MGEGDSAGAHTHLSRAGYEAQDFRNMLLSSRKQTALTQDLCRPTDVEFP